MTEINRPKGKDNEEEILTSSVDGNTRGFVAAVYVLVSHLV